MRSARLLRTLWAALIGVALLATPTEFSAVEPTRMVSMKGAEKRAIAHKALKLQVPFVENEGQVPDRHVRFYSRTFGGSVYVTDRGDLMYAFFHQPPIASEEDYALRHQPKRSLVITERLLGSSIFYPLGSEPAETKVNYFIGNDSKKWRTNLPTYNVVSLGEVSPGIDLSLKAYGKNIEKIFTVRPGADPASITLNIERAKSLLVSSSGELEVETILGPIRFSKPFAYQEKEGTKREVEVRYCLKQEGYGFATALYDKELPLIIDPSLAYSTYLGGSGLEEGKGIAVDAAGNAYVTGYTSSEDFPSLAPYQSTYVGNRDVFVTKFSPTGAILYSTFLGGTGQDSGNAIAVDAFGHAYVTGDTSGDDFPLVNPCQDHNASGIGFDAFVTKISPNGDLLVFSTYLGGGRTDQGEGIAVDPDGNVYVTGQTESNTVAFPGQPPNFPTVNAYQGQNAGGSAGGREGAGLQRHPRPQGGHPPRDAPLRRPGRPRLPRRGRRPPSRRPHPRGRRQPRPLVEVLPEDDREVPGGRDRPAHREARRRGPRARRHAARAAGAGVAAGVSSAVVERRPAGHASGGRRGAWAMRSARRMRGCGCVADGHRLSGRVNRAQLAAVASRRSGRAIRARRTGGGVRVWRETFQPRYVAAFAAGGGGREPGDAPHPRPRSLGEDGSRTRMPVPSSASAVT